MKINAESFIYKLALHSCSSDDIITFGNLINWAFLSSLSIIIGYLFSYLKLFSLALLAFVIYSYNMDWIGSGPIGPAIIMIGLMIVVAWFLLLLINLGICELVLTLACMYWAQDKYEYESKKKEVWRNIERVTDNDGFFVVCVLTVIPLFLYIMINCICLLIDKKFNLNVGFKSGSDFVDRYFERKEKNEN